MKTKFLQKTLLVTATLVSLNAAVDGEFLGMSQLQAKQAATKYKNTYKAIHDKYANTDIEASVKTFNKANADEYVAYYTSHVWPSLEKAIDAIVANDSDNLLVGGYTHPNTVAMPKGGNYRDIADSTKGALKSTLKDFIEQDLNTQDKLTALSPVQHILFPIGPIANISIEEMGFQKEHVVASVQEAVDLFMDTLVVNGTDAVLDGGTNTIPANGIHPTLDAGATKDELKAYLLSFIN